jgi:hypothetical protein
LPLERGDWIKTWFLVALGVWLGQAAAAGIGGEGAEGGPTLLGGLVTAAFILAGIALITVWRLSGRKQPTEAK